MRRWRSPFSSLTILAMLFWLGTAMAPSVSSGGASSSEGAGVDSKAVQSAESTVVTEAGPLLPWPEDYCISVCVEPPIEPSLDSNDWRPVVATTTTTAASATTAPAVAARVLPSAPPAAPRPVEEWRSLVSSYFAPEHVDQALRIISCESGGDPNAQNRSSGAAGLFQHIPRYWDGRVAAAGMAGASIFDPIANVAASAYLAYSDGWSHWAASASCWK